MIRTGAELVPGRMRAGRHAVAPRLAGGRCQSPAQAIGGTSSLPTTPPPGSDALRARYEADEALDWAAIAHEEGFADQAHLSRAVKRITGFSPGEFARRFVEDESFWIYRLWV